MCTFVDVDVCLISCVYVIIYMRVSMPDHPSGFRLALQEDIGPSSWGKYDAQLIDEVKKAVEMKRLNHDNFFRLTGGLTIGEAQEGVKLVYSKLAESFNDATEG